MRSVCWNIYFGLQRLLIQEEGQDLVEYALTMLLIVVGTVASVGVFATRLVNEFSYINTTFP